MLNVYTLAKMSSQVSRLPPSMAPPPSLHDQLPCQKTCGLPSLPTTVTLGQFFGNPYQISPKSPSLPPSTSSTFNPQPVHQYALEQASARPTANVSAHQILRARPARLALLGSTGRTAFPAPTGVKSATRVFLGQADASLARLVLPTPRTATASTESAMQTEIARVTQDGPTEVTEPSAQHAPLVSSAPLRAIALLVSSDAHSARTPLVSAAPATQDTL